MFEIIESGGTSMHVVEEFLRLILTYSLQPTA